MQHEHQSFDGGSECLACLLEDDIEREWAAIAEAKRTDEECYGPNPR